jgi:hypothetical protein
VWKVGLNHDCDDLIIGGLYGTPLLHTESGKNKNTRLQRIEAMIKVIFGGKKIVDVFKNGQVGRSVVVCCRRCLTGSLILKSKDSAPVSHWGSKKGE